MVKKNSFISSSTSSSSSSSPWTIDSLTQTLASPIFSSSIDFGFIISVLLDHDFLSLAFSVARKRNQLHAFLNIFVSDGRGSSETETTKRKGSCSAVLSVDPDVTDDDVDSNKRSTPFPWQLLLFDSKLSPTESWILVFFLKESDGLLEEFLVDADDEQIAALFRILSSSYALFINSLQLVLRFVTRLKEEDLRKCSLI